MTRRIALVPLAVAGLVLGAPTTPAATADQLPTSCSVSTSGPQSCVYLGLRGTGRLTINVSSGFGVANVGCEPTGSAFLGGWAPYSDSQSFTRTGVCVLQVSGTGFATATAN